MQANMPNPEAKGLPATRLADERQKVALLTRWQSTVGAHLAELHGALTDAQPPTKCAPLVEFTKV